MGCAKSRFQKGPEERALITDIAEVDLKGSRA